jgi:ABC-type multidrug transport system ATPase subunit
VRAGEGADVESLSEGVSVHCILKSTPNPVTGLDSVMGELVCLLLQTLAARPPKRIIITAIHSPSSRLFMLFTHVTLLTSDGRLAYWGPREEVVAS